jgi:hypothetical protein
MGLFKKRATDPGEIERLKAEIAAMGARLEAADQRLAVTDRRLDDVDSVRVELGEQVRGIVTRLDTPIAPPPHERPPPPPPPPPASTVIDSAALTEVRHRLDELAHRLDDVDARITSISTELANQIDELSGEIDAVSGGGPPADEVVEELRNAQTRLANEQARYQIAFRHDLAHLADRLKRS